MPNFDSLVKGLFLPLEERDVETNVRILKILNSEQTIVSYNMGIKGKLDLIVQIEYTSKNQLKRAIIPFELKTGENEYHGNNWQTILYCLLVMQKYKQSQDVNGILYYLRKKKLIQIVPRQDEVIYLLIRRNFLAKFLKVLYNKTDEISLPPMITSVRECNNCKMNVLCSMVNMTLEKGSDNSLRRIDSKSNDMMDIEDTPKFGAYQQVEEELTISQKVYFKHWMLLIHQEEAVEKNKEYEESDENQLKINLIEMDNFADFRELCVKRNHESSNSYQNMPIIAFSTVFDDKNKCHMFLEKYKNGDYVKITQSGLDCIMKGYIESRRFHRTKDGLNKFYAISFKLKLLPHTLQLNYERLPAFGEEEELRIIWKITNIQKDYFPIMRGNLVDLIRNPNCTRLSDLIIEEVAPKFRDLTDEEEKLIKQMKLPFVFNNDQLSALSQVNLTLLEFFVIL